MTLLQLSASGCVHNPNSAAAGGGCGSDSLPGPLKSAHFFCPQKSRFNPYLWKDLPHTHTHMDTSFSVTASFKPAPTFHVLLLEGREMLSP